MWNPESNEKQILEEFYTKAFSEAYTPMKRMLERWANFFMLSDHELGLSFIDIIEADKLAKNPSVRARIDDYKRYLHYTVLL